MDKRRSMGQVTGEIFAGDVAGCSVIIIDDLISTGTTMARVAAACRIHGAERIYVAATHGLFTGGADALWREPAIDRVIVTNTTGLVPLDAANVRGRLVVLDAAKVFAERSNAILMTIRSAICLTFAPRGSFKDCTDRSAIASGKGQSHAFRRTFRCRPVPQERSRGRRREVEIVTTHASLVFLAGDRAFKLKRAVRYPYLDFSTPERRLDACRTELELNRRTAPSLYLGVRTITREADGRLAFDGRGPLVDAVVEMRRFGQEHLFDAMAQKGALTPLLLTELARRIAAFHKSAAVSFEHGGAAGIAAVLDINDRALRGTTLVGTEVAKAFADSFRQALAAHSERLEARRKAGKVRRCHGDLILRNICLVDGEPTLFDCLEFDEALATIDVLYDLAFLLMDLWHRDQRRLANIVFNRYLDECDETDGLPLVPFFMAIRAAVRAHVTAAQADDDRGRRSGAPLSGGAGLFRSRIHAAREARPDPSRHRRLQRIRQVDDRVPGRTSRRAAPRSTDAQQRPDP